MFLRFLSIAYLTASCASGARPSAPAEWMTTTTRYSPVASHPVDHASSRILEELQQHDAERKIIDELYDSCGGKYWYGGDNSDHCAWEYVTCNDDRTIQILNLNEEEMTGTIPDSIGNLLGLEKLWFMNNELSGSILDSIGSLTNLQELYLNHNELSGSIPDSIGSLNNLQNLYLDNNELSGSIPDSIGSLNNLENLYLYDNGLTGTIPDSIGSLNNLENLNSANNELSGSTPESIGKLN